MQHQPIDRWHQLVKTKNSTGIEELLAENAVFLSPAVHTPQAGRALVAKYLRAALVVLNNDSFRYANEWYGDRSAVLEFELELDGIYVNGVDLIHWNDDGLIDHFKVMIRPLKALNNVVSLMGAQLAKTA